MKNVCVTQYLLLYFSFISHAQIKDSKTITSYEILQKADNACKDLKSIEYTVSFDQAPINVSAHIYQSKAEVKDAGFGESKVLVTGNISSPTKNTDFRFSYSGDYFKFVEGDKKVLTIENPDAYAVGRTLGFDYYMLVTKQFGSNYGMQGIIDNTVSSTYLGTEKVNGNEAYHISVSQAFENPGTKQMVESSSEWYFDVNTYLPVSFVGNAGVTVKQIDIVKINHIQNINFDINGDLNASEKIITGREPDIEGLPSIGENFPNFNLKDFKGKSLSNEVFKTNKTTIVDFWGTWCGPCVRAMPDLQELYAKYHDQGLNIIGISVLDKPGKPEAFVKSKGFTYQFLEHGDKLAKQLKLSSFPTIFIIDDNGKILHAEKGAREESKAYFESIIKREINK